jgi:hypothetical protein
MHGDVPLHESIVRWLLHQDVAGATALRGVMGYGRHRHLHRKGLLGVSDDHAIVVVAIDETEKIQNLLPALRMLAPQALITIQAISVVD